MSQENEEAIVQEIKARIQAEYSKHRELDWAYIAARKIYGSYDIKKKE